LLLREAQVKLRKADEEKLNIGMIMCQGKKLEKFNLLCAVVAGIDREESLQAVASEVCCAGNDLLR
jgi:hypothetical protein